MQLLKVNIGKRYAPPESAGLHDATANTALPGDVRTSKISFVLKTDRNPLIHRKPLTVTYEPVC